MRLKFISFSLSILLLFPAYAHSKTKTIASCNDAGKIACPNKLKPTCPENSKPTCVFLGAQQPACQTIDKENMSFGYKVNSVTCKPQGK